MDVKITDLLDDFEDGWLPLPAPKHPTHTQTERLVKQRLGVSRRWMRPARKALLAAAISLLLALGVLAGALSLLQRSRIDLGVDNPDAIAEYSEYDAAEQNTAGAQLLSSFCAGKRLIAYISVPDVTAEMNSAYRTAMDTYGMSLWSCRAKPYSVWAKQLSYDEAAQTALLRVELRADEALAPGEVTVELCFDSQENGRETTGALVDTVAVPIAPSASLQATPELTLSSSFLEADAAVQTRDAAGVLPERLSCRARRRRAGRAGQRLFRAGHGKPDRAGRAGRLPQKLEPRAERGVRGCLDFVRRRHGR